MQNGQSVRNTRNSAAEESVQPYEKKPVYLTVREILREAHVSTARMGKGYKYTLGEAIRKYAQEAAETVFVAYEERDDLNLKHQRILAIQPALHRLLINYRIASDLQQVSREACTPTIIGHDAACTKIIKL